MFTYGELKIKTYNGVAAAPIGEAPKSPPVTRSRKRKDVPEHHPKHKVYTWKAMEEESSKKTKQAVGFISEMLTIEEDPQHEGVEESK